MTATTAVIGVREAGGTFADDVRAVRMIWKRELIRFSRNRLRIATSLVQPVLFLFVLGTGLAPIAPGGGTHFDFRTFMFPGVIAMTVLFTAIFSAMSIVWDREFGFLREMLVAPVSRSSLVIGKCLGGATVATFQGVIMLALAGFVHVPYSPGLLLILVAEMALVALTLTALGTLIASRMEQVEGFMAVMQFMVLPMFFLSGALYPVANLPAWLAVLNRLDPLTYAVDPMRRLVFNHLDISAAAGRALDPGVTWWGWRLPALLEAAVVLALGLVMLAIAIWEFNATE